MPAESLPPLDPDYFGEPPARDERFTVVTRWAECVNLPEDDPTNRVEFLHRQLNEELNVLENAARSLAQFADADWEIRLWLARQCSDEARHVLAYRRLLERRGGRLGQFPVMNFQYAILGRVDSLIGRLAVQNRTFEAGGLDAVTFGIEEARAAGDQELLAMYESQQADEVVHIRFANDWIHDQITRHPRSILAMAKALTLGARAFAQVFAGGGAEVTKYGVATAERREAGFTPEEVELAGRLAAPEPGGA